MDNKTAFRIRTNEGKKEIYDTIRKRFVLLTQEEMVRQAYIAYLLQEVKVPEILISVEKKITYNTLSKRYDIVVANPNGTILIAVECKAESVNLNEDSLSQLALYNAELQAKYLVLFNGKQQIVFQKKDNSYTLISTLPPYEKMLL
ncbi:MAG: type I restriction enzyme HsdR N-terminal domain-containing protein [Bacteroidales bacterium]|nr:type I restriction enzyme HsdR N-terminal domain-containing protein [Bacteroidales bacterium]